MPHHQQATPSRTKWALVGFLAIAAFFLLTEHRAHLFGILPFLLLLACPLMHLFHGHGSHDDNSPGSDEAQGLSAPDAAPPGTRPKP